MQNEAVSKITAGIIREELETIQRSLLDYETILWAGKPSSQYSRNARLYRVLSWIIAAIVLALVMLQYCHASLAVAVASAVAVALIGGGADYSFRKDANMVYVVTQSRLLRIDLNDQSLSNDYWLERIGEASIDNARQSIEVWVRSENVYGTGRNSISRSVSIDGHNETWVSNLDMLKDLEDPAAVLDILNLARKERIKEVTKAAEIMDQPAQQLSDFMDNSTGKGATN